VLLSLLVPLSFIKLDRCAFQIIVLPTSWNQYILKQWAFYPRWNQNYLIYENIWLRANSTDSTNGSIFVWFPTYSSVSCILSPPISSFETLFTSSSTCFDYIPTCFLSLRWLLTKHITANATIATIREIPTAIIHTHLSTNLFVAGSNLIVITTSSSSSAVNVICSVVKELSTDVWFPDPPIS
jgi:hypothetical protein